MLREGLWLEGAGTAEDAGEESSWADPVLEGRLKAKKLDFLKKQKVLWASGCKACDLLPVRSGFRSDRS